MGAKDAGPITVLGLDHRARRSRDEAAGRLRQPGSQLSARGAPSAGRSSSSAASTRRGTTRTASSLLRAFRLGWKRHDQTLSFGARIKLSLVLALSWRPRLLILDEPTVGLDAIAKQQVFAELLSAVEDGDRTVLISSHGLDRPGALRRSRRHDQERADARRRPHRAT